MLGREFDPEGPSGGFNCDVMGLGKTIEVLAVSHSSINTIKNV
jgi:hypothetical protein